jgi:hypothetical protein
MRAIAETVAARKSHVSALYISNVETYLYGSDAQRFADNVDRFPKTDRSVLIRSIFGRSGSSFSVVSPLASSVTSR